MALNNRDGISKQYAKNVDQGWNERFKRLAVVSQCWHQRM